MTDSNVNTIHSQLLNLLRDTRLLLLIRKVEVRELDALEVSVLKGLAGGDPLAGLVDKHALQ